MSVPYLELIVELSETHEDPGGELVWCRAGSLGLDECYRQAEDQAKGKPRPMDGEGGHRGRAVVVLVVCGDVIKRRAGGQTVTGECKRWPEGISLLLLVCSGPDSWRSSRGLTTDCL